MSQGSKKQASRSLGDAKSKKQRVTKTVWIGGDPVKVALLNDKVGRRRRLESMTMVRGSEVPEADRQALTALDEEIEAIREELKQTAISFTFQSIGHKRYDTLLKAHPPTEEQIQKGKEENEPVPFNSDTFGFALIDASCIDPEFEEGEFEAWMRDDPDNDWNMAELLELFSAALEVNTTSGRVELGKGSPSIPNFALS